MIDPAETSLRRLLTEQARAGDWAAWDATRGILGDVLEDRGAPERWIARAQWEYVGKRQDTHGAHPPGRWWHKLRVKTTKKHSWLRWWINAYNGLPILGFDRLSLKMHQYVKASSGNLSDIDFVVFTWVPGRAGDLGRWKVDTDRHPDGFASLWVPADRRNVQPVLPGMEKNPADSV